MYKIMQMGIKCIKIPPKKVYPIEKLNNFKLTSNAVRWGWCSQIRKIEARWWESRDRWKTWKNCIPPSMHIPISAFFCLTMNLTLFARIFPGRILVILLAKYCKLENRSIAWLIFYLKNILHKIGSRRVICRDYY